MTILNFYRFKHHSGRQPVGLTFTSLAGSTHSADEQQREARRSTINLQYHCVGAPE